MLELPTKGFALSTQKHNIQLDCFCDWIEGCITWVDDRISQSDLVDALTDGNLYHDQDFAKIFISDAFLELQRRESCLGDVCPWHSESARIVRRIPWETSPAYSFCLLLSLKVLYRQHFQRFGADYNAQGSLFERLTVESLTTLGWKTHSTGWSKQSANSIRDKVHNLSVHLSEPTNKGAVERWTDDDAKDGGLDVVCHLGFRDNWAGRPLLYVQCASGENWKEKRASPVLSVWAKLIDLATHPSRGIAIPFSLLADEFRKSANYDHLTLLLDRCRVCAPVPALKQTWVSKALSDELVAWTDQRWTVLPTM